MGTRQAKYPQTRRRRNTDADRVLFADFCANHVCRILNVRDVPPRVHEMLENRRTECHATAAEVGIEMLTHCECPTLLQNGQMLLWPEDEPKPDNATALLAKPASTTGVIDGSYPASPGVKPNPAWANFQLLTQRRALWRRCSTLATGVSAVFLIPAQV
jgi:hypothetical protein